LGLYKSTVEFLKKNAGYYLLYTTKIENKQILKRRITQKFIGKKIDKKYSWRAECFSCGK
jgi:hypothetical protein